MKLAVETLLLLREPGKRDQRSDRYVGPKPFRGSENRSNQFEAQYVGSMELPTVKIL
jgi:hypothetical protein